MSSNGQSEVETAREHLTTKNGYSGDPTFSPVKHDAIENLNPDFSVSSVSLKETLETNSVVLEDDILSVKISQPENVPIVHITAAHTSPNSDIQKVPSSPKVSSLHMRKEAIKGFVLSKLSKKSQTIPDTSGSHSCDVERRTIFSGIKEKLTKKLEDRESLTKETSSPHYSPCSTPEKTSLTAELRVDLKSKSECELKSVVANDRGESYIVDEAEECFEETKKNLKDQVLSINGDKFSDQLIPPLGTPRSRTISNIAAISYKMSTTSSESNKDDKSLSFSFSDLQKADDLEDDEEDERRSSEVPEIYLEPCGSPDYSPDIGSNDHGNNFGVRNTTPPLFTRWKTFSNNAMDAFTIAMFKTTYGLTGVSAVLVYWLYWKNCAFCAGLLCGLAIFVLMYFLFHELTSPPKQAAGIIHFPDYKSLPPLTIPALAVPQSGVYEGWMNQLRGDFDQESFKMCNAVSVYVRLENQMLYLSYPKKEIPKRAMWNEVLPQNNVFIREEVHQLKGATIALLPEGLPRTRIWGKRFPLRISLLKIGRQRSPSVDCSSLTEDKPPPSPTTPSSGIHSLPASLSSSPVHAGTDLSVLHLFSRTDKEKEEWYWRFYRAIQLGKTDSCLSADNYFESIPVTLTSPVESQSENSGKSNTTPAKDEKTKTFPLPKPVLNFNHFMASLMLGLPSFDDKENAKEVDKEMPSLQWLNVLLGRVFFDFLTQEKWSDHMKQKIQRKFSRLKMPSYMHELIVTDVYLGTALPQIRRTSEPVLDERGLWLDLDIEYTGSFQMTLETKIKLQLLAKRDAIEDGEIKDENVASTTTPVISGDLMHATDDFAELTDEDDDLPDSEASKEDSTSRPVIAPPSTGARLLLRVEKWVHSTNLAENKFVKKCVGHLTQTPLLLTVEIKDLCGTLALNLPPLPTDRIWYGFRKKPQLSLTVSPKVGDHHINYNLIQKYIEKKLYLEFQKAVVLPNMDDFVIPLMHSAVYDN